MLHVIEYPFPHRITVILLATPARLDGPAYECPKGVDHRHTSYPEWRFMLGKCTEVIPGHIVSNVWAGLVISIHAFMPQLRMGNMKYFPARLCCPDAPFQLFPIQEIVSIQGTDLLNQSASHKYCAA